MPGPGHRPRPRRTCWGRSAVVGAPTSPASGLGRLENGRGAYKKGVGLGAQAALLFLPLVNKERRRQQQPARAIAPDRGNSLGLVGSRGTSRVALGRLDNCRGVIARETVPKTEHLEERLTKNGNLEERFRSFRSCKSEEKMAHTYKILGI